GYGNCFRGFDFQVQVRILRRDGQKDAIDFQSAHLTAQSTFAKGTGHESLQAKSAKNFKRLHKTSLAKCPPKANPQAGLIVIGRNLSAIIATWYRPNQIHFSPPST